jgi:multidrug transporter EmrE-like cation transporter
MNIGVVALGAVVGLVLFRERLSRLNLAGVALAVIAIGVLARG